MKASVDHQAAHPSRQLKVTLYLRQLSGKGSGDGGRSSNNHRAMVLENLSRRCTDIRIGFSVDHAGFYRTKANEHGISISEYFRQTLVQGVIAENVQDIEQRLRRLLDEIRTGGQGGCKVDIPDELLLSVFTAEHMLAAIVEAKDVQQLYEAQDKAKAKLKRMKGG